MAIVKTVFAFLFLMILSIPLLGNSPMLFGQKNQAPQFGPQKEDKKKSCKKNPLADKPLPELKTGKENALQTKDYATACKYLDAMRMVSTDAEELKNILLEMADLYYLQEEWSKAERAYNEFVLLYPGASKCDYAHYKAVLCGYKLTSEPDRDQTKTQETLKLAQEFMVQHAKSEHLQEVTTLATECREKLLASDTNVFNFYLNNKNYKAAQKRLDIITKEHVPHMPSAEPKTLELTIQLAQAQNNQEQMLLAEITLIDKYPDHDITKRIITFPDQIKAEWELAYKKKLGPIMEPTTIAQNATPQAPDFDISTIANDPLRKIDKKPVTIASAESKKSVIT